MNPVAKMTPEAKDRTRINRSLSGRKAGTALENKGKDTPIMLDTSMVNIAMKLSLLALNLS